MNNLPIIAFPILGFFLGFLCFGFVSHWLRLVLMALGKHRSGEAPPGDGARRGATIFACVHPVTWAIVLGLPWGIYRLIVTPPALVWRYFYGAALLGLMLPAVLGFIVVKRAIAAKRRDITARPPAAP